MPLYLDFEAQSEMDIRECGAFVYAAHPSTVPLCCAWALDDSQVQLWKEGEQPPAAWLDPHQLFVAHNAETEDQILRHHFNITHSAWLDTAVLCSIAGLPRKLADAAAALRTKHQKHDNSAMLQIARPRKPSRDNPARFLRPETRPDLFALLYEYCIGDVITMREVLKALPPTLWLLPAKEQKLDQLTRQMNRAGVTVDLAGIALARQAVAEHTETLQKNFARLAPGLNPRSPVRVAAAFGLPNVRKDTVREALKDTCGPHYEALTILKTLSTAATAKLNAFENRAPSGTLRGAMVFHGAGRTGRWSSMGVQLQNLIRGLGTSTPDWGPIDCHKKAMDTLFASIHAGLVTSLYKNPIRAIASGMRGFLVGPFITGDFSQIEARSLAFLAGQKDLLDAFANKLDPYKLMASRIYQKPLESITKDERFMGKQAVLGCGYGLGHKGFINMLATIYDVTVTEEEARRVVQMYRKANPAIVALWWAAERLAKRCILEQWQTFQTTPEVRGIAMRLYKRWLCVRLPSDRVLWYYEPEIHTGPEHNDIMYWGRNAAKGGKWERVKTYGGKLVENFTQAIARDIMGDAMLRCVDAGFDLRLTVHDEIVAMAADLELFTRTMKQAPTWWPGIPLDVDVQQSNRYQK